MSLCVCARACAHARVYVCALGVYVYVCYNHGQSNWKHYVRTCICPYTRIQTILFMCAYFVCMWSLSRRVGHTHTYTHTHTHTSLRRRVGYDIAVVLKATSKLLEGRLWR
jgi:hypothetical protein